MGKKRGHEQGSQHTDVSRKKPKLAPIVHQSIKPKHGNTVRDQLQSQSQSSQAQRRCSQTSSEESSLGTAHSGREDRPSQDQESAGTARLGQALNFSFPFTSSVGTSRITGQSTNPTPTPLSHLPYNGHHSTLPPLPSVTSASLASATFTHPGIVGGHTSTKLHTTYDRLEILGDAYIEVIAIRLLFNDFPELPAGRLSQQREKLVKNETLAEYALAYKFDDRAKLPRGIREAQNDKSRNGRKIWIKTMGDIFEAYVAAIILSDPSAGFQTAEAWLTALWANKLSSTTISPYERQIDAIETQKMDPNAKNHLATAVSAPEIKLEYRDTNPPQQVKKQGKVVFNIGVFLTGWGWESEHLGSGVGMSKSEAGARAASEALKNPKTKQAAELKKEHFDKVAAEKAVAEDLKALSKEMDESKSEGEI